MNASKTALLVLADGFEEIEAVTVLDVLRRAGVAVTVAGLSERDVVGAHELRVRSDCVLDSVRDQIFDVIVLPGGMPGASNLKNSQSLKTMLQQQKDAQRWIAAICAAPVVVLHAHGLLAGIRATAYPSFVNELPETHRVANQAVVRDKNFITATCPAAAMSFALSVVEALHSVERRTDLEKDLGVNH